jgi:hypothetical protein
MCELLCAGTTLSSSHLNLTVVLVVACHGMAIQSEIFCFDAYKSIETSCQPVGRAGELPSGWVRACVTQELDVVGCLSAWSSPAWRIRMTQVGKSQIPSTEDSVWGETTRILAGATRACTLSLHARGLSLPERNLGFADNCRLHNGLHVSAQHSADTGKQSMHRPPTSIQATMEPCCP